MLWPSITVTQETFTIRYTCYDEIRTGTLDTITFDERNVFNSIDKLKNKLSAMPLCTLYNQFISVGYVPCDWLNAVIVPL